MQSRFGTPLQRDVRRQVMIRVHPRDRRATVVVNELALCWRALRLMRVAPFGRAVAMANQ